MIRVIPSNERHHSDFGWLDTRWQFSFGDYHDPRNLTWGPLRVFNDDVVKGGGGFPPHPHRDMEIVSYVIDGALEHQDDMGHTEALRASEVQVMSAGRGVEHSEYNHSPTEPVHFIQLWIMPRTRGSKPRWEQKGFPAQDRRGRLLPVVSSGNVEGTLAIDQDATIYVSTLSVGQRVAHHSAAGRKAYLFVIKGALKLNGQALSAGDQARIDSEPDLAIEATADTELMLLDLPA